MLSVLADLGAVNAGTLKDVMIILLAGLAAAGAVVKMVRKQPELPQPMVTQKAPDYVSRREFERLEREVQELEGQLREMERRLLAAGEQRAVAIHDRIGPIAEVVHSLSGQLGEVVRLVHDLNAAMPRSVRKGLQ